VRIVYRRGCRKADPATDMVLRSVLQAFDEYHSLVSRAKGLAGMAENVRQGWRAGGRAPRGYRLAAPRHRGRARRRTGDEEPLWWSTTICSASWWQAYLRLRAEGVPRGVAIARLRLPWPASSTHSRWTGRR
jgi:hypothetical protein